MARVAALLLVRVGLVFLVLSVWGRLLPVPNRADAVADEFAIAVSGLLVLAGAGYLLATRGVGGTGGAAARPMRHPMSMPRTDGKEAP
jgi:hypothetical protein